MQLDANVQAMIDALTAEDAAIDETMQLLAAKRERIKAALAPLRTLLEPLEPEFDGGLAEACRQVLKKSSKPMSPLEVRDGLKTLGYDLNKHKNEMASIHSVLKRMAESKESKDVKKHDLKDGTRYSWAGEPDRVPATPPRIPSNLGEVNPHFIEFMRKMQADAAKRDADLSKMTNSPILKAIEALSKAKFGTSSAEELLRAAERARELSTLSRKLPKP